MPALWAFSHVHCGLTHMCLVLVFACASWSCPEVRDRACDAGVRLPVCMFALWGICALQIAGSNGAFVHCKLNRDKRASSHPLVWTHAALQCPCSLHSSLETLTTLIKLEIQASGSESSTRSPPLWLHSCCFSMLFAYSIEDTYNPHQVDLLCCHF